MDLDSKWLPRYLKNPFLKEPTERLTLVSDEWLKQNIEKYVNEIIKKSPSRNDVRGGAYVGDAGVAYAVLKAVACFQCRKPELLSFAKKICEQHFNIVKSNMLNGEVSYLLGSLSVYVVFILLDPESDASKKLIERVMNIGDVIATRDVHGDGDDELLSGRAGFLAAVSCLRAELGDEVVSDEIVVTVIKKMLSTGRSYSKANNFPCPLMYKYHGRHYLGAAHGLIGILHMLLCFYNLLDQVEKREVIQSLDWITTIQLKNGNIPSKFESIGIDKGENELIQWCHGATGVVHLMILAYKMLPDERYIKCAQSALDLIWEKGILLKGPGICHGVAGSGYAFLLYFRLTHDKKYLAWAHCFAQIFCSSHFKKRARVPDRPYSLFEGIAGSVCFLVDLLKPDCAQFPLVPIPFN